PDGSLGRQRCWTTSPTSPWKSAPSCTTWVGSRVPRTTSSSSTRTASCSCKDAFEPSEYPYYWRVFETADEYFDYYRDYHAFWKLYGLGLPDAVLKKLYYANAVKITPGLPYPAM